MNIFQLSHQALRLKAQNAPKVAVLFFINALSWFALDIFKVDRLDSPWILVTLMPIALLYLMERQGRVGWFEGMTLPNLLLQASTITLIWILNTKAAVPEALAYFVSAIWSAAFAFLLFRMWTFSASGQPDA